jgi:ferric-dicitrate binding protein FerR (iron transport regulator)
VSLSETTDMNLNIPWPLVTKYLRNELSQQGEQELFNWRNSSELHSLIYEEIISDNHIQDLLKAGKWNDTSAEWQAILDRIEPSVTKYSISRRKFGLALSAAATILILISLATGYFFIRYSDLKKQQANSYTYIFSPRGQRTRVILPDSTKVWLNSESSLKYSTNYNSEIREVTTEGEAFFQVHKNPEKPFLVNADEIKIKVYGTSFNVKAYSDDKSIETTLIEGKLSITSLVSQKGKGEEIFLKPNEKCIYLRKDASIQKQKNITDDEKKSEVIIKQNINPEEEKLWKYGNLIFNDETFGNLAKKIERWYDVKIHFEDEKIRNYKFTGEFNKETINQAMEALMLSSQKSYKYEIVHRDIYLKSK